jgi:hypothetical protein
MPKKIEDRRSAKRHPIPDKANAGVEVEMSSGKRRRLRLVNLSVNDLCFEVPQGAFEIRAGTDLSNVRVQIGKLHIECHITVTRTWRQFDGSYHCGARLYPKSETDQNELVSLIAAFDALQLNQSSD